MITAIFDLDGTITDSIQDLGEAVNYGLRQLGYPEHSIESYKKRVGNGAMKLCIRSLPDEKRSEAEELHGFFREFYSKHYLDNTKLYAGIYETLKKLSKNGVVLAVATNKPQDTARNMISALLPDIEFSKVLGGCDEREKKPDPAIINEILKDLPESNTVYMIGDSNVDIQTAKNSDLISIGCSWGFRGRNELEEAGADYIVSSADEIADIILR